MSKTNDADFYEASRIKKLTTLNNTKREEHFGVNRIDLENNALRDSARTNTLTFVDLE